MRSLDTAAAPAGWTMLMDAHRGAASASIAIVVGPIGRLEGDQSAAFRRRLAALSMVEGADVAIDLAAVPAIDDAAARCLADVDVLLRRNAGRLRVHRSRSQPRAKLRDAGVAAELLTFSSDRAPMDRS